MKNSYKKRISAIVLILVAGILGLTQLSQIKTASATVPYINTRVSVDGSGTQANGPSQSAGSGVTTSVSKDGRYTVFTSGASNLVGSDSNGQYDIFVKDKTNGAVTRVNVSSAGAEATGAGTLYSKISSNGRFVAFSSTATNLVASDNNINDIFVRDLVANTTEKITMDSGGGNANYHVDDYFDISSDGRYVVFSSYASDIVANDTNNNYDVFVRDRVLGTTTLLSKDSGGTLGNGSSRNVSISCEGSVIAFSSAASNLVASDTNGKWDVFVIKRIGTDQISNITISGNNHTATTAPTDVSCDGNTVVFESGATNLVSPSTSSYNIFSHNIYDATTQLISKSTGGTEGNAESSYPTVSGDGRYVSFKSIATNLIGSDTNGEDDIFIRDTLQNTTEIISMRNSTTQTTNGSYDPAISDDGRYIVYFSRDNGLVSGDSNGYEDVFRAETGATPCSI